MIVLAGGNAYKLEHEHKNGWNSEAFKERYSEVLDRYDYIVGDWGYSQLRLRGFYAEGNPRANKDSTIAGLVDYLNEYCNFGCAYFVLSKADASMVPPGTPDLLKEGEPAAAADPSAEGEADAQTAETAAAAAGGNGILMRWPLKERPGGPVRIPGAAAMARAAQEAERRSQQAAQANARGGDFRSSASGRGGPDGGYSGRGGRSQGGAGSDKRQGSGPHAGQADRSGGRQGQGSRGPRPQGSERQGAGAPARSGGQWRQQPDSVRHAESSRGPEGGGSRPDSAKGGSRWPGKNKRRGRFGGKPHRPDGGSPGGGPAGKHGGDQ